MWNEAEHTTITETSALAEAYATTDNGEWREGEKKDEEEEDYGDIFHWQDTLMREVCRERVGEGMGMNQRGWSKK